MSRSAKKGPYVDEKLYKKVNRLNENKAKQPIRTWARACTIIPEIVGHTFEVHNGNKFLKVFVQEDMVGHKLGEFSPTRMFRGHSSKKRASVMIEKVGRSAVANANEQSTTPVRNTLFVAKAWADPGPTIRRFQPKDRGKAYSIMKRTSHLVVALDERGEK